MTLKRTIELLKEYLKMNNIIELTDVNKYRIDEINKIRDYFNNEIKERKDIIKKLNKYIVSFNYLDKIFISLSESFSALDNNVSIIFNLFFANTIALLYFFFLILVNFSNDLLIPVPTVNTKVKEAPVTPAGIPTTEAYEAILNVLNDSDSKFMKNLLILLMKQIFVKILKKILRNLR